MTNNDNNPPAPLYKGPITWELLNQRHDSYDEDRVNKLNLLLKGGYDIVRCAKVFMPQWKAENPQAYKDRLGFASYENNFGEIINDYSSTLFSKPLAVLPATDADDDDTPGEEPDSSTPYMQWQRKFTLDNQSMSDFMKTVQNESNATSCSYFGIDFKEDGKTPYAYCIDPCSVLDWETDEEGNFIFLVLRDDECVRTSVRQSRNTITTTFTVWTRVNEDVQFDQYQIIYPKDQEPKGDTPVPHIAKDDAKLSFKDIPVIECRTEDSICVGQLIGPAAGALYMRYSTFLFCLNRGLNPLLVYKQGAELPANGDLAIMNEDEGRGEFTVNRANTQGKAIIGPSDELTYAEMSGNVFAIAQDQLNKDKNELYRLVSSLNSLISNQGVSTAQTKASGVAKMMDNTAKEHMLESYAKDVKEWVLKAFKVAFRALDSKDVVWQCKGMDNYKVVDEDTLMARIAILPMYKTNMPSKTSYKQILMDTAYDMHAFTNIGTMNKIQQEIAENVDKMDMDPVHTAVDQQGAMAADAAKSLDKAVPQKPVKE